MATPISATTANTNSNANKAALQVSADASFLDQASQAINNAVSLGKFFVVLTSFENCNLIYLQNYFIGLGYRVSYPDPHNPNQIIGPAQLFGNALVSFFENGGTPTPLKNPVRIRLDWPPDNQQDSDI